MDFENIILVLIHIEEKILRKKVFLSFKFLRRKRGALFCHVNKVIFIMSFVFLTILINQTWRGKKANLIIKAREVRMFLILFIFMKIEEEKRITKALILWIEKYFILFSFFLSLFIIEIIRIILISKKIQEINQEKEKKIREYEYRTILIFVIFKESIKRDLYS
jgi:hypothetical protein